MRFPTVFLAFVVCALGVTIEARQPEVTVALIPLDSRPATATLPVEVAAVGGLRVQTPPLELLGDATRGAQPDALYAWLEGVSADSLVVSIDALAYGGLVQSRTSDLSADDAWARVAGVRAWQAKTKKPVYAFVTIPRNPDATNRPRNLSVIRKAFDWAADGTLARLYVTWDDALPGSPAPAEGARLRAEAEVRGLKNVLVYPGADEAATTLISSLALEGNRAKPRVRVEYSDPRKRDVIVVYDGQPLQDSVAMQARAAGVELVDAADAGNLDATLYVYNGGDMRAAALRISALGRRGKVALVDIAEVNKAASKLLDDTVTLQRFMNLYAFAAWGTPGNNLGTALAQTAMRVKGGSGPAAARLLLREYVNDYLYSTIVRPQIRARYGDLTLDTEMARRELLEYLRSVFKPSKLSRTDCLAIENADFPWARSFEVRLEVKVSAAGTSGCGA